MTETLKCPFKTAAFEIRDECQPSCKWNVGGTCAVESLAASLGEIAAMLRSAKDAGEGGMHD